MNKYIKLILIFTGVWLIAALANGFVSGILIIVLDDMYGKGGVGTLLLSLIFSFVFSAPVVGLVWFIALMAQIKNKRGHDLFQLVLGTTLIVASITAVIFIFSIGTGFMKARFFVALCIIFSALSAVLFFRKQIKTNA
jgi:hypothetical protein